MRRKELETIHGNQVNGNLSDMVYLIDEYGLYDFWADYRDYISELYLTNNTLFSQSVIVYHRLKEKN